MPKFPFIAGMLYYLIFGLEKSKKFHWNLWFICNSHFNSPYLIGLRRISRPSTATWVYLRLRSHQRYQYRLILSSVPVFLYIFRLLIAFVLLSPKNSLSLLLLSFSPSHSPCKVFTLPPIFFYIFLHFSLHFNLIIFW